MKQKCFCGLRTLALRAEFCFHRKGKFFWKKAGREKIWSLRNIHLRFSLPLCLFSLRPLYSVPMPRQRLVSRGLPNHIFLYCRHTASIRSQELLCLFCVIRMAFLHLWIFLAWIYKLLARGYLVLGKGTKGHNLVLLGYLASRGEIQSQSTFLERMAPC